MCCTDTEQNNKYAYAQDSDCGVTYAMKYLLISSALLTLPSMNTFTPVKISGSGCTGGGREGGRERERERERGKNELTFQNLHNRAYVHVLQVHTCVHVCA